MYKCDKCDKEFKTQQGLNSHIGWHNKPKRKNNLEEYKKKIERGEIKGDNQFTKAKKEGIKIIVSNETRKKISEASKKQIWSDERRTKHSESMKKAVINNPDSYSANNVSGRTKTLDYKGKKLKGTWELLVAEWLDKYNIKWTNSINGIPYEWEGNIHYYFPDFYLPKYDMYIEVKGYERERDRCKWGVLNNLIIIKKKEIELIKNNNFGPLAQW